MRKLINANVILRCGSKEIELGTVYAADMLSIICSAFVPKARDRMELIKKNIEPVFE